MKKVLIVTYYWPPAGGPGVQRWLKFVKYLPEFGIEPIVYCPKNPSYPTLDHSLEQEIDSNVTVLKSEIWEPNRFFKLGFKNKSDQFSKGLIPPKDRQSIFDRILLAIRGNLFIPDARKFWVKPSIKFLSDYISKNQIETIITTGPPHSLHLIGQQLKTQFPLRWITDFRDPWTAISYHNQFYLSSFAHQIHRTLESEVLNTTDHIITTSDATKQLFKPMTKTPITTITNGFDVQTLPKISLDEAFTLTHIGALHQDRNPTLLWSVLSEIIIENQDFKRDFELVLVGDISPHVLASIRAHGLESALCQVGAVSHNEAVTFQHQTQVLLLIEANTTAASYIIPGKVFEYLNAQRPIVALGPKTSDIQAILEDTQTGFYFDYSKESALKTHILALYDAYKTQSLTMTPKNINRFTRRSCTKQLAEVILR